MIHFVVFCGCDGLLRLSLVGEDAATETQDRRQGSGRSQLKDSGVETGIRGLSEDGISHLCARPECLGCWIFGSLSGISRVVQGSYGDLVDGGDAIEK
jgi:hypothetical protein